MGYKGVIRGTDSRDGSVGRIPAAHVGLSGAVDGDLGESADRRVEVRRNPTGGLLPGRFPVSRMGTGCAFHMYLLLGAGICGSHLGQDTAAGYIGYPSRVIFHRTEG